MTALLYLLAAATTAAGLFAFFAPLAFYAAFAEYTGGTNAHLVRDVGAAYLTAGLAMAWGARVPRWRGPLVSTAAVFLLLHAVGHVIDLVSGAVPLSHVLLDAVQVFVPAILVSALAMASVKSSGT
jgi:hypothetical protein